MNKSQGVSFPSTFGEFFRQKRISLGFTLRSFCERYGYDPGNISRLERGILPPTEDQDKLQALAKALGLKEESSEWVTFFDLAYISKGKIPSDILSKPRATEHLPLLFRTARGKKLSKKKLQALIKILRES